MKIKNLKEEVRSDAREFDVINRQITILAYDQAKTAEDFKNILTYLDKMKKRVQDAMEEKGVSIDNNKLNADVLRALLREIGNIREIRLNIHLIGNIKYTDDGSAITFNCNATDNEVKLYIDNNDIVAKNLSEHGTVHKNYDIHCENIMNNDPMRKGFTKIEDFAVEVYNTFIKDTKKY